MYTNFKKLHSKDDNDFQICTCFSGYSGLGTNVGNAAGQGLLPKEKKYLLHIKYFRILLTHYVFQSNIYLLPKIAFYILLNKKNVEQKKWGLLLSITLNKGTL